ncbi:MAG: 6-phosphogluconolactonase [Spongiibacteraceae bacterium]
MAVNKTYSHTPSNHVVQRWHVAGDFDALTDAVVTRLSQCASEAIAERGVFSIVLAGGNTPQAIYRELSELATDWRAWFVYFGDERCLPIGDSERNDAMAQRCWLDHVPIPRQQIFTIPAELGAEAGASAYANILAHVSAFDLVLLGLGEDGHTASLFPGLPSSNQPAFAVHNAPKLPRDRISMSAARLSHARNVWFLASGEGKRVALKQLHDAEMIPAAMIKPMGGVDIFTDVDDVR